MPEPHLTEEELARFQDGEFSERTAGHLEWCAECKTRLGDLEAAIAAYADYRSSRSPLFPAPPQPWRALPALQEESIAAQPRLRRYWWQIPAWAAAVCAVVATVMVLRHPAEPVIPPANELLARSAAAELPSSRRIAMHLAGRTLVRPAVLTSEDFPERDADWRRLARLFDEARYSWRDPLSARSFQAWRSGLAGRRDKVSLIRTGSPEQAYRVQTETQSGVLRSASLTLRGRQLRPTGGSFEFQGEAPLEMEESDAPVAEAARAPESKPRAEETPASPADTLRVLAALNQIGADVGEPITVSEDERHRVLVSASGLSAERRAQVSEVLRGLPRVKLDLDAAPSSVPGATRPTPPESGPSSVNAPLRNQFEERLGGAVALQETTDRVLEWGASAVAVAHALDVLDTRFPPAVEMTLRVADRQVLHGLRRGHLGTLRNLVTQIRNELKPLLPASTAAAPPVPGENLVVTVGNVDSALNRLLAGSYTLAEGQAARNLLAQKLEILRHRIDEALK